MLVVVEYPICEDELDMGMNVLESLEFGVELGDVPDKMVFPNERVDIGALETGETAEDEDVLKSLG